MHAILGAETLQAARLYVAQKMQTGPMQASQHTIASQAGDKVR